MELLDRYLNEVRRNLPSKDQGDVIAEISDELQSQFEERERQIDRPLTGDEAAAIIKAYGHPKLVASRYAEHRYLIGPELLPFYWYVLKLVLAVAIGLELFGSAVSAIASGNARLFTAGLGWIWSTPLIVFGIVTLVFALVERFHTRPVLVEIGADRWDPRRLPKAGGSAPYPRYKSAFEFAANVLALLVLLDVAGARHGLFTLTFGSGAGLVSALQLTAAWQPVYASLVAGTALVAAGAAVVYVKPDWNALRLGLQVAASAIFAAGIGMTMRAGALLAVHGTAVSAADALALQTLVSISLFITLCAVALAGAVSLWRLVKTLQRVRG